MKDQLITFETAKLAQEKGFDQNIRPTYWTDGNLTNTTNGDVRHLYCSAPTQSLLQKWLRETHKIDIYIQGYGFGYYPMLNNVPPANQKDILCVDRRWNLQNKENLNFKTYEQALEEGLYKALKLIKTK